MEIRFSSDIVEVAEQQLKRGETDPVWMQEFMQPVGFVHSEEWCMRFARACWYWAYQRHNEPLDSLFANSIGSAAGLLEDAEEVKRVHNEPFIGAIVIYVAMRPNWLKELRWVGFHCGICVAVTSDHKTIWAIEGNTDETGRDNGDKVCRIERPLKNCRFIF